jgi:drug/metabolite transporter (DMT)-like permease
VNNPNNIRGSVHFPGVRSTMGMIVLSEEMVGQMLLVCSSILFSMSFVGSRFAMISTVSSIGPWTFNALRYSVSFVLLLVVEPILRKHPIFKFPEPEPKKAGDLVKMPNGVVDIQESTPAERQPLDVSQSLPREKQESTLSISRISRKMMYIILIQGSSNFVASILLQVGLETLAVSKAAFITSCYVIVIPFVECCLPLISGEKIECLTTKLWFDVILCILGVYLISGCMGGDVSCFGSFQDNGEMYVILSVVFWVVNIMICDEAGKYHDSILLTLGDFAVVALLTIGFSVVFERESWVYPFNDIFSAWPVIVFVGIFEAFAYLLSTVGQIYVRPSRAAIIYSGESLFTCLGGYLFLGEVLTPSEILGGGLICMSSVLTSLSFVEDEEEVEEEVEVVETHSPEISGIEEFRPVFDPKVLSPLLHFPPKSPKQRAIEGEEKQYQYLPPYMQMRRQRGGSISRYPLFRSKPATHFECSRPIAIPSPTAIPSNTAQRISHYGSLPKESNISDYMLEMQQLASSV